LTCYTLFNIVLHEMKNKLETKQDFINMRNALINKPIYKMKMNTELPTHAVEFEHVYFSHIFYGKIKKSKKILFSGFYQECYEFMQKSKASLEFCNYSKEFNAYEFKLVAIDSLKQPYRNQAMQFVNP